MKNYHKVCWLIANTPLNENFLRNIYFREFENLFSIYSLYMKYSKRTFKRRPRRRGPKATTAKKLVEGHGMTRIEKLAWGVGAVGALARAVLPYVKSNNAEAKFYDVTFTASPLLAAPTINNISNMAQGLTESTRIGNSIKVKDLVLRYQIAPNYTGFAYENIRLMIIVDKMQDGVAPTAAEIFQNTGFYNSPLNKNFTDRFALLKDQYIDLLQQGSNQLAGKIYVKLDYHIRYLGTGSAVADQGPGTLYVITTNRENANAPAINCYSRLNYFDN